MKSLLKVVATIAFYAFVVVVAMWTASLTLGEVRDLLPNDPVTPFFALALFDGGAFVWLLVFISKAKGLYQRGVSLIMLLLDLAGVVAISAARLITGGQTMTAIPPELGAAVVYGVAVMTAINFLGAYAFHVTDPETLAEIEARSLEDELYQEAQDQARANMDQQKAALAAVLAGRATAKIKARLYLPLTNQEAQSIEGLDLSDYAPAGQIIEAKPKKPAQGVPAWMVAAGQMFKRNRKRQPVTTYEQRTQAATEEAGASPAPFPMDQDSPSSTGQDDPA